MKIFDAVQNFFDSIGQYLNNNQSNLFWIFLGAFLVVSLVVIAITSFSYECMLTKTIDRINKFLERNPRINDDNLVAFNNMMKASSVPKTLRRQWQQFMLYREHPASYYMSFKHCVENPLRNSSYRQQMTVYKIISYVLIVLSFIVSAFMASQVYSTSVVIQDIIIVPLIILIAYWLISMVLDLIHSAISADLFQNYQYFEINMDKAMLTLPEFVDYEVLFSQDEIRHGIPVLFAYLQKRAIQEQQELEKARLKSVDHEKFDFNEAGLDGSLVLDRAMRETENYTSQRKKYMQEIERVNNEIAVMENNHRERVKDFQRQVQTSKETIENLKEQLEQASSTIEINYIKKQMRDELNRQQVAEKDFDIITDKHNQEVKSLNQEIKHYEEEIKNAKEGLESAMFSEFNTYSIKVYNNLEKIVDDKMQDKVDDYKDQIKSLEGQLEEKNEELENVYTRYQEVLAQVPVEQNDIPEESYTEIPSKKGKKKKKGSKQETFEDNLTAQPEQDEEMIQDMAGQDYQYNQDYDYNEQQYQQDINSSSDEFATDYNYQNYDEQYAPADGEYVDNYQYDNAGYADGTQYDANAYDMQNEEQYQYADNTEYDVNNEQYVPLGNEEYAPASDDYNAQYEYANNENEQYGYDAQYVDTQNDTVSTEEYQPQDYTYVPLSEEQTQDYTYVPMAEEQAQDYQPATQETEHAPQEQSNDDEGDDGDDEFGINPEYIEGVVDVEDNQQQEQDDDFDDNDFYMDFSKESDDDATDFDAIFGDKTIEPKTKEEESGEDKGIDETQPVDEDFDINKVLGLYDEFENESSSQPKAEVKPAELTLEQVVEDDEDEEMPMDEFDDFEDLAESDEEELPAPSEKRKAGRPRKIVDEDDIKPKRKPGRPKKIQPETSDEQPKRKPGRPRKEQDGSEVLEQPKRKAGRPRKVEVEDVKPKRKAGRPRKVESQDSEPKRKVGRPKKQSADTEVLNKPKRKAGRPRKSENNQPKNKVGRPRKETVKRSVGRPRKEDSVSAKQTKGKRGRPRKN